ncbi:hypothetical protein REPUB_Repub14bG0007100 [Reevesia pubescens]
MGFGVRKDSSRHDKNGVLLMKHFACSKEGHRAEKWEKLEKRMREPKRSSRTDCGANIRVILNKNTGKWCVSHCDMEHNHDMVNPSQLCFIRSNRVIKAADVCEAKAMKNSGIKTCQVMNFFASQSGGIKNAGFTRKDLYNRLAAERRVEIFDGDVQATLVYFNVKKEMDNGFYMQYTTDEEKQIKNIFWVDSTSRSDYACFGDVLAFDTTYNKNTFNLPLLVFIGVNHHHMTTIFGLALLTNEDAESFIWALNTFLDCMMNKKPIYVVTDEDLAMRKALKMVLPGVRHRLCSWHISRNAKANIPNLDFVQDFKACMKSWWTIDKFERAWVEMVEKYALKDHQWINEMYRKKHMWAQAYLSGHFFETLRSTSRYEGINALIAFLTKEKKTLLEFVRALEDGIKNVRNNELEEDYITMHTEPITSHPFKEIEKHAASVYTNRSFNKFRDQLRLHALYSHENRIQIDSSTMVYTLSKYREPSKQMRVEFHEVDECIKCSCLKFETEGMPCAHAIHVMILEQFNRIPSQLIMNRWTQNAKADALAIVDQNVESKYTTKLRYASLNSSCSRLYYVASKFAETYNKARSEIASLTRRFEEMCKVDLEGILAFTEHVDDPTRVKTKGKHVPKDQIKKKSRRCGHCRMEGHTKNKCPYLELTLSSLFQVIVWMTRLILIAMIMITLQAHPKLVDYFVMILLR